MTTRGELTGRTGVPAELDPLKKLRRRRMVAQSRRNGLFPTTAWRYLVPADDTFEGTGPWPTGVSVRDGILHGELQTLVDEVVGARSAADSGRDVSIALLVEPTAAELTTAVSVLGDGGRLVIELQPSRLRTMTGIRKRLAGTGLIVDELYSVSPSDDGWQPTLWLPTSGSGPVHELLQAGTAWPGRGRIRKLVRRIASRGVRFASVFTERPWLLFPTRPWAVLAVAGLGSGGTAETGVDAGIAAGPGLRVLRLGGSSTDQPIVTHHDRTTGDPFAVTKLPTEPSEIEDLQVEIENLRSLNDTAPNLSGVPRLIRSAGPGGAVPCHLTQSYIAGMPLAAVLDPNNYGPWLESVAAWAGSLGLATGVRGEPLGRTVTGWLDELEDSAPDLVRRSRPFVDRLELDLRVTQHLDFGPWNIHGGPSGIGVVDWATADRNGLPAADLVHYLTHAAALVSGGYGRDELATVHHATLDPLTPIGWSVAEALAGYCATVGIDRAWVPTLRLAGWIGSVWRRLPTAGDTIYRWLWEWELTAIERTSSPPDGHTSSK